MSDDATTEPLPTAADSARPPSMQLTGFAAGVTGAALLVAGVWGLHVLAPAGGAAGTVGWVILLCLAFTALGKGITLLRRALAPLTAAALAPLAPTSAPMRATAGIAMGAAGIWWVMRGHAATWWAHTTGTGAVTDTAIGWTLTSQLVAVAFMVMFGALLFSGAKTLAAAIFANSGTRNRNDNQQNPNQQWWALWWSSHPGLGLTLLAGAAALVFLSGYVVPHVSKWLTGDDPMAALAAITAILVVAFAANTWWWKALSGWWQWAQTHGGGGGGASPLGQMQAGTAVVALIWFSAMGFGLATPSDYTGPGAIPLAHAQCPPDCGGGDNGGGSYGPNASQFQPPQMPAQQPDYQGGINQPPLDQNSGISIYNQNSAQGGQSAPQQAGQNIGQQTGQRAAHGQPLPNYGPWQPDAQPPVQAPVQQAPAQQPVQQAPQAPQQPAQAPQNPVGQQPAGQTPQQPGAQQPQGQPGQQPAQQSPTQSGQTQPGQQSQPGQQNEPKQNPVDQQQQQIQRQQEQLQEKQKQADELRKKLQDQLDQDSDSSDDDDDADNDPTTSAVAATQRRKSLLDKGKEMVDKQVERAPKYAIQGASAGVNALLKRNLNVSQAALSESQRLVKASSNVINDSIRAGSRVTTADPAIGAAMNTIRSETPKIPGLVSKVGNLSTVTKVLGKGTGPALAPLAAYYDIKDGMAPGKAIAANAASVGAGLLAGAAMAALAPAAPAVAVVVVGAAAGVAAYQGVKWAYGKLPEGAQQAIDSGLRATGEAAKEAGKSVVNGAKSLWSGAKSLFS
ncbi:hypothetical protein [Mycobacteroides abscessus]|uniref:hypothetical protein n=1 Tax=Mycobacteroides abscessus TaxID=36809 RepID=UPI001896964C